MGYYKKLLVVEDEQAARDRLIRKLSHYGFEVVAVSNGHEAWERLDKGERFDAIISDQQMPGMTGLELLTRVRRDTRTREVPFILVSAMMNPSGLIETVETFTRSCFMPKPIDCDRLIDVIC